MGNPDRYYRALPEQLNRRIRNELNAEVIPSTKDDLPMVPKFFLEAKGLDGSASVWLGGRHTIMVLQE